MGTNIIVGDDMDAMARHLDEILAGKKKTGRIPPLWDGHASDRIAAILVERFPGPV